MRSLVDDSDTLIATVTQPVATVSWINDNQLALSAGGGRGETRRHDQTPEYSGSKIIYTVTERTAGTPADTYVLPVSGGTPVKYTAGGGGFGGRGGNRWIDSTRFLIDRQTPDFKRRTISIGSVAGGEPKLVHEDVKSRWMDDEPDRDARTESEGLRAGVARVAHRSARAAAAGAARHRRRERAVPPFSAADRCG